MCVKCDDEYVNLMMMMDVICNDTIIYVHNTCDEYDGMITCDIQWCYCVQVEHDQNECLVHSDNQCYEWW